MINNINTELLEMAMKIINKYLNNLTEIEKDNKMINDSMKVLENKELKTVPVEIKKPEKTCENKSNEKKVYNDYGKMTMDFKTWYNNLSYGTEYNIKDITKALGKEINHTRNFIYQSKHINSIVQSDLISKTCNNRHMHLYKKQHEMIYERPVQAKSKKGITATTKEEKKVSAA